MLFLLFFSLLKFHKSDEISLKMKTYIVLALVVCALCAVVQADNNEGKSINQSIIRNRAPLFYKILKYGVHCTAARLGLCKFG